jgi:inorganic pyrophosphatase
MKSFTIDAIIEIPYGSMYKYEVDKLKGDLKVDRPLPAPIPYNYGYISETLHGDGDPLDVCILSTNPLQPLSRVNVEIFGVLRCNDNGSSDDKLIGIVSGEKVSDLLFKHMLGQVKEYLQSYKTGFVIEEDEVDCGALVAYGIYVQDRDRFQERAEGKAY